MKVNKIRNYKILPMGLAFVIAASYGGSAAAKTNDAQPVSREIYSESSSKYISAPSAPEYVGEPIYIKSDTAAVSEDSGAVLTDYNGKKQVLLWTAEKGSINFTVNAPMEGYYKLGVSYVPVIQKENDIEITVKVNGETPFREAELIPLQRTWKNDGDFRVDGLGNEFSPEQVQVENWALQWFWDKDGLQTKPLSFLLREGENQVTIVSESGAFAIEALAMGGLKAPENYSQYKIKHEKEEIYRGEPVKIEGESALFKSSKELRPLADRSDPAVTPSDIYLQKLNMIGSTNWKTPGSKITWEFEAPSDGLYKLSFKYRQSYLLNGTSSRRLLIDGEARFSEMENILFPYDTQWKLNSLGGETPQLVFLEKGLHTLTLEVTLGDMAEISRELERLVFDIGELYRTMVMITGSTPDVNRDYRLADQIPGLLEKLSGYSESLGKLAARLDIIAGKKGSSNAAVLRNLQAVINRMLKSKFRIHEYVKDYFTNYCSVSASLYEMRNMPLDIDAIFLSAPEEDLSQYTSSIIERAMFSVQKFFVSFTGDYNTISTVESDKKITLWVGWGRDQAQVLSAMIKDEFTSQTGIAVDIKIVSASLIQAILSGSPPDCSLMLSRSQPVNLAMRGALLDLSQFGDYDKTMDRFAKGAEIPYSYKGGVYGLPDTQQFFMLFTRDDILEKFGLKAPTTWEELLRSAAILMRNQLMIGVPYTQITDVSQLDMGIGSLSIYPALLYQYNSSVYNKDLTATNLMSPESVQAFDFWTALYRKYKFPVTYDFYNRFRTGEMPIAIAPYTEYARLMSAAPEIRGRWSIGQVPGVIGEDGELRRTVAGSGSASVILKVSKQQELAWEFIKWWTSAEAQSRYSTEIESILGVVARHPTSNLEAFKNQAWKKSDEAQILNQWGVVREVPEVPGGYFTQRAVDNAFWNTVNYNAVPRDILIKWARLTDEEIERKIAEYEK